MPKSTRRTFLKAAGTTCLATVFGGSFAFKTLAAAKDPMANYDYAGWENLHRDEWSWDKKTRGAHLANCTGACPHFVYTKNGVVLREEQSRDMPSFDGIPEYNPRGCNKGSCATDYLYGPHRVKYPLIRTGERGEGKWRRATWDEALEMIAEKVVDTIRDHAPDCISVFTPVPAVAPISFSAGHRWAHLIGAHTHTFFDWYGDHPTGTTQTLGIQGDSCETADWFNAKMIILWGSNPVWTRIPDAHFLTEAAINGSQLVSISPDYNASSTKADTWIHPKPGTDAALALGVAHVIIKEGLYDAANLKEQTDMPLLVRADTSLFLRESDMVKGGSGAKFYTWDTKTKKPVMIKGSWGEEPKKKPPIQPPFFGRNTLTFPKGYLALGDLDPALEGTFKVKLQDGSYVKVRPVFADYKDRIMKNYSPKQASAITGVNAATIEKLAMDLGKTKPAMIITGAGSNHWYYSDVMLRTFHFLMALTGNDGHNGGGVNHYIGQWKPVPLPGVGALSFPKGVKKHRFCQTTIWSCIHSEVYDAMDNVGIDTGAYLRESLKTGQMPMYPREGRDPKVFIVYRGNFLNQAKGQKYMLRNLWPKLELIVNANFRMDSTALYSDIVLPAAHWYEKTDLNMTHEHTFVNLTEPAIKPLWEAKTDWDIFKLLAKKVAEVAVKKGFPKYYDEQFKWARNLSTLYEQQTSNGTLETDVQAVEFFLKKAPHTKGITLDLLRKKGVQRFKLNWTSAMKENVPYTPFQHFIVGKKPWPTMTGRQQFYIDHKTFFEMGVELPVYKAPIEADPYPLLINTHHSRHAIHSTWKDSVLMLRLHRGGPLIEMSPVDAKARRLRDNDWAEAWNDHGRIIARVKIRSGERVGRISVCHTPELYQDLIEGSSQSVLPIRIAPTAIVGNYAHLRFKPNYYGPSGSNRDTRVEVKRYLGSVPL